MNQHNYQPGVQCVYNVSEPLSTLDPVLVSSYEMEGYSNRKMSFKGLIKMLDNHGQYSWEDEGRLFAYDDEEQYVDITNYDLFDMLSFLNY